MLALLDTLKKVRILHSRLDDKVNRALKECLQAFLEVKVSVGVGAGRKGLEFDQEVQVAVLRVEVVPQG